MSSGTPALNGRRLHLMSARLIQRVYDRSAPFYSVSTALFHTRAHRRALELAGPIEGSRVLEVAIGSGELFRELLGRNQTGLTAGVDLSPGMVSLVRKRLNENGGGNGRHNGHGTGRFLLEAVDARAMPFADASFDLLFNCYLFELLQPQDMERTAREFHRVMRPGGKLIAVNVSDNSPMFNTIYGFLGYALPSFWGRSVAAHLPELLARAGFRIGHREVVSQTLYPSLVSVAERL